MHVIFFIHHVCTIWFLSCYLLFSACPGCIRIRTRLSSSNSMTFSMTFSSFPWPFGLDLAVTCENFKNFPCFRVFFYLKQFNRHKLWCPPKCGPLALFNHSSLHYCILHCPSAVTLIFYDFQGPTIKFHDFPGLENEILTFHDFPGFPWPVRTLCIHIRSFLNGQKDFKFFPPPPF